MEISCEQIQSLVFEYIDDTMEEDIKASIDKHLHGCEACREFYSSEKRMADLLKNSMALAAESLTLPFHFKKAIPRHLAWGLAASLILVVSLLTIYILVILPADHEQDTLHLMLENRAEHFTANPVDNWIEGRLEIAVMDISKEKDITRKIYTTESTRTENKGKSLEEIKNMGG